MNAVSGGALAVLVFVFPALYGEGYDVIGSVTRGDFSPLTAYGMFSVESGRTVVAVAVVAAMLACKGAAASLTNSGGGVAGDFAPTLFAGCLADGCSPHVPVRRPVSVCRCVISHSSAWPESCRGR